MSMYFLFKIWIFCQGCNIWRLRGWVRRVPGGGVCRRLLPGVLPKTKTSKVGSLLHLWNTFRLILFACRCQVKRNTISRRSSLTRGSRPRRRTSQSQCPPSTVSSSSPPPTSWGRSATGCATTLTLATSSCSASWSPPLCWQRKTPPTHSPRGTMWETNHVWHLANSLLADTQLFWLLFHHNLHYRADSEDHRLRVHPAQKRFLSERVQPARHARRCCLPHILRIQVGRLVK